MPKMNPNKFLLLGGILLIVLGLLGLVKIIGPGADASIFGAYWWFDAAESWSSLILGAIAVAGVFWLPAHMQKAYAIMLGAAGVLLGLYSIFVGPAFLSANLEVPADTIFTLLFGAWGLFAGFRREINLP